MSCTLQQDPKVVSIQCYDKGLVLNLCLRHM